MPNELPHVTMSEVAWKVPNEFDVSIVPTETIVNALWVFKDN